MFITLATVKHKQKQRRSLKVIFFKTSTVDSLEPEPSHLLYTVQDLPFLHMLNVLYEADCGGKRKSVNKVEIILFVVSLLKTWAKSAKR